MSLTTADSLKKQKFEQLIDSFRSESSDLHQVWTFVKSNASDAESYSFKVGHIKIENRKIDKAVSGFVETAKITMKVLDELEDINPFVKIASLSFKLVVGLALKTKENHSKVTSVLIHIQSMFCVFLQLRDRKLVVEPGPDGHDHPLVVLMNRIADDIEECGNTCECYMKESSLRKILKSPFYESRLADHITTFMEHRQNLTLALGVQNTVQLEEVHDQVAENTKLLSSIQKDLKQLFERLDSSKERELRYVIQKNGPRTCLENGTILQELIMKAEDSSFQKSNKVAGVTGISNLALFAVQRQDDDSETLSINDIQKILRKEMEEDFDTFLKKSFEQFRGKLEIERKEMEILVKKEGDRIISHFYDGYQRIGNPHVRYVWKEMDWRGSIKAVDFVFALRDYFLSPMWNTDIWPMPSSDIPASEIRDNSTLHSSLSSQSTDEWTKQYINVSHLQPILEAFDDDGSGFITIQEVNRFILDCPNDWSFLQWLAYWAAGWHISINDYKRNIYTLLRRMVKLLQTALPANYMSLFYYLDSYGLQDIGKLLRSTADRDDKQDEQELLNLVQDMKGRDDRRLKDNLKSIGYNIDSVATVRLVCGEGRIDKHIYPLINSLLEHHIKIFHLAQKHILHFDELDYCADSLFYIFGAFHNRVKDLEATFTQLHINREDKFNNYAFGMFKFQASDEKVKELDIFYSVSDKLDLFDQQDNNGQDLDDSILNFGIQSPLTLQPLELCSFQSEVHELSGIFGEWTGMLMRSTNEGYVSEYGLLRLNFVEPMSTEALVISGQGEFFGGKLEIEGIYIITDPRVGIDIVVTGIGGGWFRCRGTLDSTVMTITGDWFNEGSKPTPGDPITVSCDDHFLLTKTPVNLSRFRFATQALGKNPYRVLWKFAIDSVLYQVRCQMRAAALVYEGLSEIAQLKKVYIRHMMDEGGYSASKYSIDEDRDIFMALISKIPPSISYFIISSCVHIFNRLNKHHWFSCNNCSRWLIHSRIACMSCTDGSSSGFDLCLNCLYDDNASPSLEDHGFIHNEETHSLIYTRFPFNSNVGFGGLLADAQKHSKNVKAIFASIEAQRLSYTNKTMSSVKGVQLDSIASCKYCAQLVKPPCWLTLPDGRTFICDPCCQKHILYPFQNRFILPKLSDQMLLLRIKSSQKEKIVAKDGLKRIELQLEQTNIDMERRISELERNMFERTNTLEGLVKGLQNVSDTSPDVITNVVDEDLLGVRTQDPNAKLTENIASVSAEEPVKKHIQVDQSTVQRLSVIESRLSGLEGAMTEILKILHRQSESIEKLHRHNEASTTKGQEAGVTEDLNEGD